MGGDALSTGVTSLRFSDWRQLPSLCDAVPAGGWL
jgi:hypothetical protein